MQYTLLVSALAAATAAQQLTSDLNYMNTRWGQVSPYKNQPETGFGVEIPGLPSGCQVEQAHILHRHAQRFPTGGTEDGANDIRFYDKVKKFLKKNPGSQFTGLLSFLNTYEQFVDSSGLLTGIGAATEFKAGVDFWNRYGRILYNASVAQLHYQYSEELHKPKIVLRTTNESRIENSQINWALGFFGPSYRSVPTPELTGLQKPFEVVYLDEGGTATENNTLASYVSCSNSNVDDIGYIGDHDVYKYIPKYLGPATKRMQSYAPSGFTFGTNDTYAMQSLCAYETAYLGDGQSAFCPLFTKPEWDGFENTLDIEYFYDYSYGNPTGRAQGIGYVEELIARLEKQYIMVSNSSVNSTQDDNPMTFPLNQKFYADFSHDDILVSTMTAMSLDYFRDPPSLTMFPPDPNRRFILSHMTPFGSRLVTEVIGCASQNPTPLSPAEKNRVQYYQTQWGYDPSNAKNKFIRMRLNHGLLPLSTIRGGFCANGRPDGMCAMQDFLNSQKNAYKLSQYNYACFGNYTLANPFGGLDYDGAPPPK